MRGKIIISKQEAENMLRFGRAHIAETLPPDENGIIYVGLKRDDTQHLVYYIRNKTMQVRLKRKRL